ncbi:hypothetical protein QFZ28_003029 [Neobacillus niacini]|uniref:hypothetical protein n=1 Tax=Neobacillus niacini TaxID=86668 RepID=UPI00277FC247|nr:hypothetical protein [Neobacillus niacini]MDQ1002629.1 hypothetical protein [Neobacillus niacini]
MKVDMHWSEKEQIHLLKVYVNKANYDLKVLINQEKNGYYEPLESVANLEDSSVKLCKVCKPLHLYNETMEQFFGVK